MSNLEAIHQAQPSVRIPRNERSEKDAALDKLMNQTLETQDMRPGKKGQQIFKTLYTRRADRMRKRL